MKSLLELEPGDSFQVAIADSSGEQIDVLVISDEEEQWHIGGETPLVMMPLGKAQAVFDELFYQGLS